jgi:outer membrane protein
MKKNKIFLLISLLFLGNSLVRGQEVMTLEQSIKLTLENNFSIKIAKEESNLSKNNNNLGNAGMLPDLSANAAYQNSSNNTQQVFVDGREINRDGAKSTNLNGGLALNWTLFDGMQMFVERSKLKDLEAIGQLQYKLRIENTISTLMTQYYETVRIKYLISYQQQQIQILSTRESYVKNRFNAGLGPKIDVLQTEVDKNNAQMNLLSLQQQYNNALFNLHLIMGMKGKPNYEVETTLPEPMVLEENTLEKSMKEKNTEVKSAEILVGLSEKEIKKLRGQQLPKLGLNMGYNFTRNTAEAGFLLSNQNLGFYYGLTASVPLFTGFTTRTKIQNAMILRKAEGLRLEEIVLSKELSLKQAFANLAALREMLPVIQKNMELAKELASIADDRFKSGSSTILELREAEQTAFQAANDLAALQVNIKKEEVGLLKITGALLRN